MRRAGCAAAVALAAAMGWAGSALADESKIPAQHRLVYKLVTAARWNPLGAVLDTRLAYRYRLYRSASAALRDNHLGVYLRPQASPAFARIDVGLELQPLTVLTLRVAAGFPAYFGSFDRLQSFSSPRDAHSDQDLEDLGDVDRNYSTTGSLVHLQAIARAKVGPIAVLNELSLMRWSMNLRRGDRFFYNSALDTVVSGSGYGLVNNAHLFYIVPFFKGLVAGVRYTATHAYYSEDDYPNRGQLGNPNTPIHMIGPMFLYRFFDRAGARYNQPTVIFILNWYLAHRYRTGKDVSRAIPYGAVAFTFTGDLL